VRILQVITSLLTGGAEHIVVQLAERLSLKPGVHCDICVFDGEETPFCQEIEAWNKEHAGENIEPIRIIRLGKGFYSVRYVWQLARLMRHYDIVHTHNSSPQLFAACAKVLCAFGHGHVPVLCTTEHNTMNRKRSWKWYAPVESWMYSQYSHIVCISKIAEDKLREYMGGKWLDDTASPWYNRISTINNGVDVEKINTAQPDVELLRLKGNRKSIVMIARFRPQKDHDTLVRAMTRLDKQRYELWLVGVGERQAEVEALARQLGVSENVRFLGLRMDVPNVLRAADIVVMSSHWEGLSLSNVEGMSAGKPFLASRVNGLREVTEGYGILFREGDDAEVAAIVRRLSADRALYDFVAARCHRRAMQYDLGKMVERYYAVYQGCTV
jgi:glycosyltransferase involved in cell wall biosynthesis